MKQPAPSTIKIIVLTLIIDLVGFSIIFPLYPSMLEYYLAREGTSGVLGSLIAILEQFDSVAGGGIVVLFGGFLGSLYSLLQFLCAPALGALSDRYGRKPVLVVSIAGITISYALWVVASHFWVLLLARFVGGIMSANISTASAVVADITTPQTRSRGMATIGMAVGIGFIIGPAIGGLTSVVDLTEYWPSLTAWGFNPYSVPALVALVLSVVNLVLMCVKFEETLVRDKTDTALPRRTVNPIALFHTQKYPGVTRTNFTYFLFLAAFSGMEFSLSFVVAERFAYGPVQIALLLLFAGIVLALMQGGYVRRRSSVIGSRRMSVHGLMCSIPGLFIVGAATAPWMVYAGLFLMAAGSAQVIPCLTALVSVYTPDNDQGRVLGVFRSLGALARAVGPLVACFVYWRLGSANAYYMVAGLTVVPLLLARTLPTPEHE